MSLKLQMPAKHILENKYNKFGITISDIAREYNTSNPTVRKWLTANNITIKTHKKACQEKSNLHKINSKPPKDLLQILYETKSINDLEIYFSVGQQTIYEWLEEYNITLKTLSKSIKIQKDIKWKTMIPSREEILNEYSVNGNLISLEEKFNLSKSSIKKLLNQYNIETIKPWRSNAEIKLYDYVNEISNNSFTNSNKSIINPFELDMVSHKHMLAIEYCGIYWHSELNNKDKSYHLNKKEKCIQKGFDLITIFETDNQEFVKSIIKTKIGLNQKIYARDCEIKEIHDKKEARFFCDTYHLQRYHNSSINIGLYYKNDLKMVLSMSKSRFNKTFDWECIRMTTMHGFTVIGGASRLFKYFIKNYNPLSIITYSDRRFGEGGVYLNCGFKFEGYTPPSYHYFNKKKTNILLSRVKFQKHKLIDFYNYNKNLTEWEIMQKEGYDRIWDCGHCKYTMFFN